MAHKAGPAKPLISTKVAVWGLVIGLAFMFGSLIVSNGASKTNGDSKTPKQPIVKVIEVELKEKEWTDWIRLESGDKWQIDAPGWVEYRFWDGTKRYVADKSTRWLGKINSSTFQLRGASGNAKITIERYGN